MTNEALTTAIEEKPLTTHPLGERITLAIILTLMALIVCAALAFGFDAVVATQTDVLFILLDDWGFGDVGWRNDGPGWTATPNLEALKNDGVELLQYYTNPICSPSRATIQTGRYTIRTGIQHGCYSANMATGLPLTERTLANGFSNAGYETWGFGKWHLGFNNKSFTPTHRGFDSWYGHYNAAVEAYNKTFGFIATDNSPLAGIDWHRANASMDAVPTEENYAHSSQMLVTEFERKMDARDAKAPSNFSSIKPLFAFVAFHMVHLADGSASSRTAPKLAVCDSKKNKCLEAPQKYVAPFVANASLGYDRAAFLGMVSLVDEAVGNVTRRWKRRASSRPSIIVITSDNGSPPDMRGQVGNLPLRGFKHEMWEGGMRVPALVIGDGSIGGTILPRAVTSTALFHASDWLPTLLANAAGVTDPAAHAADGHLDGIDQWSALAGAPRATSVRTELLHNIDTSDPPLRGFYAALRQGDLKLIIFHNRTRVLFNISADASEERDLARLPRYRDELQSMANRIKALDNETVNCWGGTGLVQLPPHFRGDCDTILPRLPCHTPPVWVADWCPTPPGPGPKPPHTFGCDSKLPTQFCRTTGHICGNDKVMLHRGPQNRTVCTNICKSFANCNCFDMEDLSRKFPCKVYSDTTSLTVKQGHTAYVRGTEKRVA